MILPTILPTFIHLMIIAKKKTTELCIEKQTKQKYNTSFKRFKRRVASTNFRTLKRKRKIARERARKKFSI